MSNSAREALAKSCWCPNCVGDYNSDYADEAEKRISEAGYAIVKVGDVPPWMRHADTVFYDDGDPGSDDERVFWAQLYENPTERKYDEDEVNG